MKETLKTKSSQKLAEFLDKNKIHKKDFAQMIGVTLSYIYNLIDNTIPFSTRSTTLERIAVVMDVEPEIFEEYRIPQEPVIIDDSILKIKETIKSKKIKISDYLKTFPRNKRLDVVDMLRGALPLPIDYNELKAICNGIGMNNKDIFNIWQNRFKQILETNGMNIYTNNELVDNLTSCAQKYIMSKN